MSNLLIKKMAKMYKHIKKLSVFSMIFTLLATSCSLEIEDTDSIQTVGGSAVFNGVESVPAAIDQLYNDIRSQTEAQDNLYALTEVTTDELLVPTRGTDWGDNGVWRTLHAHTWGATHSHIVNVWNDKNSAILRATQIIDPLSNASAEELAHAKFCRAYNMWLIMDFFGQVPFREAADGPDVIPDVMTRSEAYQMVVQDLTDAIANLPASAPTASDKTRAVKATAQFFLAKVKLNAAVYNGSYGANDLQDVIDLVDAIEGDGYSLVGGNYFDIFKGTNVTNTDVIWNVKASTGNRMWDGLHYNQSHKENTGGGWNGFTTLAEFYDKFEGPADNNSIGGSQEERRGYTHTAASTDSINQGFGYGFQLGQMYGWDFKNKVLKTLENRTGDPLAFTKELPGLIGNNEVTGIRLLKYSPADGAFAQGVVMARFGDAYLMRAEAKLRKGDNAGALADVNALRAMRANTPDLASLTEQDLLDERARELYTEGWRRNDLIRFGVFKDAWEFKEAGDGHTDLFAIPSSALLSNPGLIQNPGY